MMVSSFTPRSQWQASAIVDMGSKSDGSSILGLCHTCGGPVLHDQPLALAWSYPGFCGDLEKEPVEGISLSLWNKLKFLFNVKSRKKMVDSFSMSKVKAKSRNWVSVKNSLGYSCGAEG